MQRRSVGRSTATNPENSHQRAPAQRGRDRQSPGRGPDGQEAHSALRGHQVVGSGRRPAAAHCGQSARRRGWRLCRVSGHRHGAWAAPVVGQEQPRIAPRPATAAMQPVAVVRRASSRSTGLWLALGCAASRRASASHRHRASTSWLPRGAPPGPIVSPLQQPCRDRVSLDQKAGTALSLEQELGVGSMARSEVLAL